MLITQLQEGRYLPSGFGNVAQLAEQVTLNHKITGSIPVIPILWVVGIAARTGHNEGWIGILGTRRGFRKMGLGRAMLL